MHKPKAIIVGCEGLTLSKEEESLFHSEQPLGFILFDRNINTPEQVKELCNCLRNTVGRQEAPILIDQEGGKVARFKGRREWPESPAFELFGKLYEENPIKAIDAIELNILLQASYLRDMGITVNCSPVLDLRFKGAHDIIGSRALSYDPETVALLGKVICHAFLRAGITPVIKHIPGHGRALADSHLELPVVSQSLEELEKTDFYPFRAIYDDELLQQAVWGMVAHILYPVCDTEKPATTSRKVVEEICRGQLNGQGFMIADDIGMKALQGDYETRARETVLSGLDATLACNHTFDELKRILQAAPEMTDVAYERFVYAETVRENFFQKSHGVLPALDQLKQELDSILMASQKQTLVS